MLCCSAVSRLFATSWTAAPQVPLSMEFSRKEHWSGLLFPHPADVPDTRMEPMSPASPEPAGRLIPSSLSRLESLYTDRQTDTHMHTYTHVCVLSRPAVSNSLWPVDCCPPGSSIRGIPQVRILQWVAISFSRGSSQPRDQTQVFCIAGGFFTIWTNREIIHTHTHTHTHTPESLCSTVETNITVQINHNSIRSSKHCFLRNFSCEYNFKN